MTEPTSIGRYAIEKVLGQGGMGRVYLARDSVLGRRVAIKVLRGDLGLPPETREALLSRMKNEARAAAAISHPNIVTLHDMGEDDALGLYLVFEYVEGPTLRERLQKGHLELAAEMLARFPVEAKGQRRPLAKRHERNQQSLLLRRHLGKTIKPQPAQL